LDEDDDDDRLLTELGKKIGSDILVKNNAVGREGRIRGNASGSGKGWFPPADETAMSKPHAGSGMMPARASDGATWCMKFGTSAQGVIDLEANTEIAVDMTMEGDAYPLEYEELPEEIMVMQERRTIKVAMDSGAGDHVCSPEDVWGLEVVPSAASIAGRGFIAANGARILNQGQVPVKLMESAGGRIDTTFQVADVSRPLFSMSRICDQGNEVTVNSKEAVVKRDGKVVTRFKREGGLYVAELAMMPPGKDTAPKPEAGFGRQGNHA
jgi:hypothetical protein